MNKVIKVIDLFNMLANGEELPQKIKYKNNEYNLYYSNADRKEWYWKKSTEGYWGCWGDNLFISSNCLNDNVEIIEDNPKIDIQSIEGLKDDTGDYTADIICYRINEVITAVKQLDKEIKEIKE